MKFCDFLWVHKVLRTYFANCKAGEERKLRVFENMALRITFGPRRDEVTGEWRRLHNEELCDLYSSPKLRG